MPATGYHVDALAVTCRWIYVGPIITLVALPAAVVGRSPWAALWLVTMCFLVCAATAVVTNVMCSTNSALQ